MHSITLRVPICIICSAASQKSSLTHSPTRTLSITSTYSTEYHQPAALLFPLARGLCLHLHHTPVVPSIPQSLQRCLSHSPCNCTHLTKEIHSTYSLSLRPCLFLPLYACRQRVLGEVNALVNKWAREHSEKEVRVRFGFCSSRVSCTCVVSSLPRHFWSELLARLCLASSLHLLHLIWFSFFSLCFRVRYRFVSGQSQLFWPLVWLQNYVFLAPTLVSYAIPFFLSLCFCLDLCQLRFLLFNGSHHSFHFSYCLVRLFPQRTFAFTLIFCSLFTPGSILPHHLSCLSLSFSFPILFFHFDSVACPPRMPRRSPSAFSLLDRTDSASTHKVC